MRSVSSNIMFAINMLCIYVAPGTKFALIIDDKMVKNKLQLHYYK